MKTQTQTSKKAQTAKTASKKAQTSKADAPIAWAVVVLAEIMAGKFSPAAVRYYARAAEWNSARPYNDRHPGTALMSEADARENIKKHATISGFLQSPGVKKPMEKVYDAMRMQARDLGAEKFKGLVQSIKGAQ